VRNERGLTKVVLSSLATAATEVDDKEGGGVGEREDAEAKTERKEVKVKVKVKERSGKEKDSYEDPVEGVTKESDDIKGRKIKVGTDVVPGCVFLKQIHLHTSVIPDIIIYNSVA
jgi:hypothetical protein